MSFLPFCVILFSVLVISSLSYDELAKWDRLALCMPITRRQVVASKYVLHLIFTAVGVLLGLLIGVLSLLIHDGGDYRALLTLVATSAAIALVYGALVLPLIFRYGPEKGRITIILLALVPAALVGTGISIGGSPSEELIARLVYFAPGSGAHSLWNLLSHQRQNLRKETVLAHKKRSAPALLFLYSIFLQPLVLFPLLLRLQSGKHTRRLRAPS